MAVTPMSERVRVGSPVKDLEQRQASGELETCLLEFALQGRFPSCTELPDSFQSGSLEYYANWLRYLTLRDKKKRERGAVVSYDANHHSLLFPARPRVGELTIELKYPRAQCHIPLLKVHSHPDSSCFSDSDLMGFSNQLKTPVHVGPERAIQIATARYNYLLIMTEEAKNMISTPGDNEFSRYDGLFCDIGHLEVHRHFTSDPRTSWLLRDSIFNNFRRAIYITFIQTLYLSIKYKLRLYYSSGDGRYRRAGKSEIQEILTEEIEERL
jgi:hypothetical protein